MGRRIGLGSAVGLVVSMMFWRGNQTLHLSSGVSIFPDGVTFIALAVLLAAAVRLDLRRTNPHGRSTSLLAGLTVGAATGVVFGSAVVLLGTLRFSNPALSLHAFGFLTAFGSALACGAAAALPRSGAAPARAM